MTKVGKGEWTGPCPRCGGSDRFSVTARDQPGGGLFFCRGQSVGRKGCDWSGDIFTLLEETKGLDYCESREYLGLPPDEFCKEMGEDQKEQIRRKERAEKRRKERQYQDWKRLVKMFWVKDRMTEEEMSEFRRLRQRPERVREARSALREYLTTHAEIKADTSALQTDGSPSHPLKKQVSGRLYKGPEWSRLPEKHLPEAKKLLQEARMTEAEIQEQKEKCEEFLQQVEERLKDEDKFFTDYAQKKTLRRKFEESNFA